MASVCVDVSHSSPFTISFFLRCLESNVVRFIRSGDALVHELFGLLDGVVMQIVDPFFGVEGFIVLHTVTAFFLSKYTEGC